MKKDDLELVRGSGNVYRDFERPNAGLEQARAITAARIIRVLDERRLSARDAEKLTGVSYSEFSRIRNTRPSASPPDSPIRRRPPRCCSERPAGSAGRPAFRRPSV